MTGQQKNEVIYRTAIYCRLSKDDGNTSESASIGTQKEMLSQYVKSQGWHIESYYIDDGFTGLNFDRPEFQRMLKDIEAEKIDCVITKDLSRLGRNYLDCGAYIEMFFPEHRVRYIALNDGVDTINSAACDITPFRNILNEMYSKDISKKVKTAKKARFMQGKFMGTRAPYGYHKDPRDKNHLVIDESTAPTVRRIFKLAKEGLGIAKIRQIMTNEKVPRPATIVFDNEHGSYDRYFEGNEENKYIWSNNSVRGILRNPVYAGHLAGGKRPCLSFKSKKRLVAKIEDWDIVRDTHEPIISNDEFELVQRLITSRRTGELGSLGYDNVFAGIIKCADCGYAMRANAAHRTKRTDVIDMIVYSCNNYAVYGNKACTKHTLEAREIQNAVLADINRHARMALKDGSKMVRKIEQKLNQNSKSESKSVEKELKKANIRIAELDRLFSLLYEDRANGDISERNYKAMSKRYEQEQLQLEKRITELTTLLDETTQISQGAVDFIALVKNYEGIEKLTAPIVNTLIDRITVSEPEMIDGERVQKIKIFYKFIGWLA